MVKDGHYPLVKRQCRFFVCQPPSLKEKEPALAALRIAFVRLKTAIAPNASSSHKRGQQESGLLGQLTD
jgi:hypothetical protein